METSTQKSQTAINNETKSKTPSHFARRLALLAIVVGVASGCKTTDHKLPHEHWKPPGMLMSILLLAILTGLSACSVRKIKDPLTGAVIYESHRFGNTEKFDSITATYVDKDGNTNTICIKGYISDQVAGMRAAFEGAGTLVGKATSTMVKP